MRRLLTVEHAFAIEGPGVVVVPFAAEPLAEGGLHVACVFPDATKAELPEGTQVWRDGA